MDAGPEGCGGAQQLLSEAWPRHSVRLGMGHFLDAQQYPAGPASALPGGMGMLRLRWQMMGVAPGGIGKIHSAGLRKGKRTPKATVDFHQRDTPRRPIPAELHHSDPIPTNVPEQPQGTLDQR